MFGPILKLLYGANCHFDSGPKQRIYYTSKMDWVTSDFADAIKNVIMIHEISINDAQRKVEKLTPISNEMLEFVSNEDGISHARAQDLFITNLFAD